MLALTAVLSTLAFSIVQAFPLTTRDVWSPTITSPNANSEWVIGTKQLVTWNTANKPNDLTNPTGRVVLGQMANNSLNLQLNNPLAQNFNLTDGQVQITVPNVPPSDDYIVVLMGDSGNTSPTFVITRISQGNISSSVSHDAIEVASTSLPSAGSAFSSITLTDGVDASSFSTKSSAPFTAANQLTTTPAASAPGSTATLSSPSSSTSALSNSTTSGTSTSSTSTKSNDAWSWTRTRSNIAIAGSLAMGLAILI